MSVRTDLVLVEKANSIALVTLNRPQALNALSMALREVLGETFEALQRDGQTRVAILTGAGRAFCAGVDLKELGSGDRKLDHSRLGEGITRFGLAGFDGPIIAAVNGFAITGGLELALCCDIRIASTHARFADTHARVGVMPGGRVSALLPRLIGLARAKEMSLTGNFIDAATAERWGLVNRVVEPEALIPTCRKLAEDMLTIEPEFLKTYNRLIEENFELNYGSAIMHELALASAINRRLDPAEVERRRAGIQSRGRAQRQ